MISMRSDSFVAANKLITKTNAGTLKKIKETVGPPYLFAAVGS